MRQHSSFPLLMGPKETKVRILWAVDNLGSAPGWLSMFMWPTVFLRCSLLSSPILLALSVWTTNVSKQEQPLTLCWVFSMRKRYCGLWTMQTHWSFFIVYFLLPCQRILVCLQVGRAQGTHLIQTTGNFYSPVSFVAEGARCSLASLPLWRWHRNNKVTGVFVLEMLEVKMTT